MAALSAAALLLAATPPAQATDASMSAEARATADLAFCMGQADQELLGRTGDGDASVGRFRIAQRLTWPLRALFNDRFWPN